MAAPPAPKADPLGISVPSALSWDEDTQAVYGQPPPGSSTTSSVALQTLGARPTPKKSPPTKPSFSALSTPQIFPDASRPGLFTSEPASLSPTEDTPEKRTVAEPPLSASLRGGVPGSSHLRGHHRASVPGFTHSRSLSHDGVRHPRRWETLSKFSQPTPNIPNDEPKRPWRSGEKFHFKLLNAQEDGHWETHYAICREYDKERCTAWKEEITQLIIFVALFAAVAVAFLMICIPKLKEDPDEVRNDLLAHMVDQFDIYFAAVKNNSLETANFTFMPERTPFEPPASVVRQSGAMLLSITISLSAVLIGSICLQWLREYQRDPRLGPKEAAAVRQMKHDGFNFWRVPLIIAWLPVLLQLAVGVFFWGLSEMLWAMNRGIAYLNLVVIGFAFLFVILTTLAPAIQNLMIGQNWVRGPQVPFKSFLARCFAIIILFVARCTLYFLSPKLEGRNIRFSRQRVFIRKMCKALTETSVEDWVAYDMAWQAERMVELSRISAQESRDVPRVIEWVATTHVASQRAIAAIYGALRDMYPSTSMQVLRHLLVGGRGGVDATLVERVDKFAKEWRLEQINQEQTDEGVEDVLTDLKCALVLDQLVKNNPALRTALLDIRTELFIRILNHNSARKDYQLNIWDTFDDGDGGQKGTGVWSARLLVPFSKSKEAEDYLLIPDGLKVQVILTFKAYLHKGEYRDVLWEITLGLVLKIVTCQTHASEELVGELSTLHDDLICFWTNLPNNGRDHARVYFKLMHYVQRFDHAKSIRVNPPPSPMTASSSKSPVSVAAVPCAGRSRGLFGNRLVQFEERMEYLKEAIGSPLGLDS